MTWEAAELMRGSLDHCVKCTICESACPVAAVTPLFPGPKYEGPQAERFRTHEPSVDASLDYCSGCGICTLVCPQGVHVAHVVIDGGIDGERLRASSPQRAAVAGADALLDPEAIAETYWQLHQQHRSAWTHELDLRPYKERF